LLVVGCGGDETGSPNTARFDPARIQAGVRTVERVAAAPAITSFQLVGRHLNDLAGASPVAGIGLSSRDRLVESIGRILSAVAPPNGAQLVPIIRSGLLGKTFVYHADTKKYEVDRARTGAPANGVRFILYQVGEDGVPVEPLTETGYSDLTDEKASAADAVGLRLRVVAGAVTYLDYRFDIAGSIGSATFRVAGFLSDGTDRVNFDLSARSALFGTEKPIEIDATLEVPSQNFRVVLSLETRTGPNAATVDLVVTAGSDRVTDNARFTATSIDARIEVNGKLLATATGTPEHPIIRGEGGRELTAEETAALAAVVGLLDGIIKLVGGLLAPIGALLMMGLGL
jgi:hypothetical protein